MMHPARECKRMDVCRECLRRRQRLLPPLLLVTGASATLLLPLLLLRRLRLLPLRLRL